MGLSCSQVTLLTLTQRKADLELGISDCSSDKMALTRQMSQLSSEYRSQLQAAKISYYYNNQYNNMTYEYLMGSSTNFTMLWNSDKYALKSQTSMILTDYNGRVVLSDSYADKITSVLGSGAMDADGKGGTFSKDRIPEMIANLAQGYATLDEIKAVINGDDIAESTIDMPMGNTLGLGDASTRRDVDNTSGKQDRIAALVQFYYPIFLAAASNGWTTEYNKDMATNKDYISDALVTGSFQLATVTEEGAYAEGCNLDYYVTNGWVNQRTDSEAREELVAWYEEEKAILTEKETALDLQIDDMSTELEAINTEIQSIQSFIDDACQSVFDWGSA